MYLRYSYCRVVLILSVCIILWQIVQPVFSINCFGSLISLYQNLHFLGIKDLVMVINYYIHNLFSLHSSNLYHNISLIADHACNYHMVLVLDGNSEISAHVWSNLCYLTCSRHLVRSRAVTNRIFFLRKGLFSFMRAQHDLRYHLI